MKPQTTARLAYRAAALLQPYARAGSGADIRLDKKIPTGGGLGGGSSDAATVLMVLNRWWQCGFSREELIRLGVKLGADVPFFIFGQSAFAKGIGEELSPFEVPEQWYVVVRPNVHVATAKIFAHQDLTRDSKPSIMPTFQTLRPFQNDMQAVVFREYPEVWKAFNDMSQYGKPLMTGSGSCLFLSFDNQEKAQSIHRQVSQSYEAYCVGGLNTHPLYHMV